MRSLDILVGCEMSGRVRDELIRLGHNAVSCDLKDTMSPGPHIKGDLLRAIKSQRWDALIAFPDCTYLTNAAEWAYGDADYKRYPGVGYHQKVSSEKKYGAERRAARIQAVDFVQALIGSGIPRIAIENPVGHLSSVIGEPAQIIQPWAFGEDASKGTCLWLYGLEPLKPTFCVAPRLGKGGRPVWGNQTASGQNALSPADNRAEVRALTYMGIARAMARQWFGSAMEQAA